MPYADAVYDYADFAIADDAAADAAIILPLSLLMLLLAIRHDMPPALLISFAAAMITPYDAAAATPFCH